VAAFPVPKTALLRNTVPHKMCNMKNITLSVDEKVLVAVRRYAAERDPFRAANPLRKWGPGG
jgi:hypothetical protein